MSVELTASLKQPILRTKLHRPVPTSDILVRRRLFQKLDAGRGKPLTLVSGPAGYGKSVLISSWVQECGSPCAWISLDEADNDLRVFLSYLVAAVHRIVPDALDEIGSYVEAASLPPVSVIARTLINALDEVAEEFILVLDDYHVIHEGPVNELLDEMLRYPPQGVHLAVLTRRDPRLRISRMRAQGRVNEVRITELRFTREEVVQLYEQLLDLKIDEKTSGDLAKVTEGWITALRLAALTMERAEDVERALTRMGGGSHLVSDFLVEEVLTRQPSDVQDCLMRTSVLNRLSPALAEALCVAERGKDEHRLSGQEFIEWLVNANLFVIALDGERTWFRYHHLFQQLLQNRLKARRSPEQIAAYHATASTWYRENDHIDEAIQHAIAAGDAEAAAQIVEESRYAILNDDKPYILSRWLEMLPEEIKKQRPDLLLAQAWVSFYRLDYVAVSTFVEEVQKIAGGDKQHPTLRGELDFFRGYFQYWQDEASQSEESLRNAVEVIPERYKMMRGEAELHYGLALKMNGKGEEALRMLHDLLYVRRIPEDARRARVVGGLCFIGFLEGELEEVVNASQQLQSLGSNLKSSYLEVWAHYFQACVAYLRNDLERAVQLFDKVVMNRYILDPRFAVDAIAGLALAHQLRGEAGKAGETLQLLEDFASETNDLVCLSVIRSTQAHLSLVQGDAEAALRCQQMVNLEYDTGAMFTWLELPRLTRCRVLLAEGSPASVLEAQKRLEEYAEYNESRCNDLQLIRVLGLLVLAYAKQSKTDEATSLLARALTIARRGRFIRPFLDLGPPVAELLERLGEEDAPADYVGEILKAFTQDRGRTKGGALEMRAESSVESLSQRELEILTLMAEGLRNDEIAGRLFISGGTVKNHLYNIYQKLGVHNRIRALDKARELGFLAAQ